MKYIISLVFVFYSITLVSQKYIVQNLNGDRVEGVLFYSDDKSLSSNKTGEVDLSSFNLYDEIEIYHISYMYQKIVKKNIKDKIIILKSNPIKIKEVSVHSSLKMEENKTQVIQLNKTEIQESLSKNPAELLEKSVGVNVQKSQNGGGSPNIRGFEANRILLVVDGVKLNNTIYRSGHLQNILSIDPYILESVSVLHGPSSVFYGSGALGGSIVLNTLNIKNLQENKTSFTQQFESSSSSVSLNFYSLYKSGKTSFLSSVSLKKHGNLRMGNNRFHNYSDWGEEKFATIGDEQLYGEYSQVDITQKTHFQINKNSYLAFNSQYSTTSNINRFDKLNDVTNNNPKYKYWYYGPQRRTLHSVDYNKIYKSIMSDDFNIHLSYQGVEESRNIQKFDENVIIKRKESINICDSKLDFKKQIKKLKINYGVSSRFQELSSVGKSHFEDGDISFATSRYPDDGSTDVNFSSFLHTEFNLFENLKWYNALRYDYNKISMCFSEENPFNLGENLSLVNNNYSASSNFFFSSNNNSFLSLSVFNSFRNPNIDDIGKVFSKTQGIVVVPNLNLKSEKIVTSELIWKYISNFTTFEVVLFHNSLKDAIEKREFTFNGQDSILYDGEMMKCIANTNINSAKMNGFNLNLKQNVSKNLFVSTTTTFVKSLSSDSLPLAHIPPFSARGNISYIFKDQSKLSFYSNFNGWKRAEDFDVNGVDNLEEATVDGTPSWITFNTTYSKKIKSLIVSFSCENIFDVHYKTFASGISASGRNFILNLQSQF